MKQNLMSSLLLILVFSSAITACLGNPLPRISTENLDVISNSDSTHENDTPDSSQLASLIYSQLSHGTDAIPSNEITEIGNVHSDDVTTESKTISASPVIITENDEAIRIVSSGVEESDQNDNPFLRLKRDASKDKCTADLSEVIEELGLTNEKLSFLGITMEHRAQSPLPTQPAGPRSSDEDGWEDKKDLGRRSTCPYNVTKTDLGPDFFPRYQYEAISNCYYCEGSEVERCAKLRQEVTYLVRGGCQDGVPQLYAKKATITVAYSCVRASPPGEQPTVPGVGLPGGPASTD